MTCSRNELMDNGFCAETGSECPQDLRCSQWELEMDAQQEKRPCCSYCGEPFDMSGKPKWVRRGDLVKDGNGRYQPPTMYEISGGAHWRNKADMGR